MNSVLAKMAVQIAANTAGFDKAMMKSSQTIQKFSIEAELSNTRVGGLAKTIAGFANPVTATIAAVTGLAAAYATSTIGAKDLEFAQNQLGAATMLLTNSFASLFSSAKDGEGIVSKLTNQFLNFLNPALAATSKALAMTQEALEDLRRDELVARAESNELLEDNVEKLTVLKEGSEDYAEKIHLAGEMLANVNKAEGLVLGTLNEQLKAKETQLNTDKENEKLQDEFRLIQLEISQESRKYERLRQQILRVESNITEQYQKQKSHIKSIGEVNFMPDLEAEGSTNPELRNEQAANEAKRFSEELIAISKSAEFAGGALITLEEPMNQFKEVAKEVIDVSGLVAGGIADIANAFGEAASGSVNFGDAIIKSLASFAQQFGALLIATGIGKIAFNKFSGPAMIAAGAALVALGGAVRGAISNRPSLSGGGDSGSIGGVGRVTTQNGFAQNSGPQMQLETLIRGQDLYVVLSNYERNNRSTRG